MIVKPLVFISSTSDRHADRSALAHALGPTFEAYLFENDRARASSPQQRCAEMLSSCDAFIGIIGSEYGSSFEEDIAGSARSITEWEFDTASERSDLAMLMFVSSDIQDKDVEPNQQRFLERIQSFKHGVWCKFFSSPRELVGLVKTSLVQWLAEYLVQAKSRAGTLSKKRLRLAFAMSAFMLLLVLGSVTGYLMYDMFYQSTVLTICGIAAGAIAALAMLVLSDG